MKDAPFVFLNDRETYSSICGTVLVSEHGIAYDLEQLWERIPILIREKCRIGPAIDVLKLEPELEEELR